MKHEIWSDEHTQTLIAMKAEGRTSVEIAQALGKCSGSVRSRWLWLNMSEAQRESRRERVNLYRRGKRGVTTRSRMGPQSSWSDQEIETLLHKRDVEKKKWNVIAAELDRPMQTCSNKWYKIKNPNPVHDRVISFTKTIVPDEVVQDRLRRQMLEPRDLTAAFFGDPPVGYSALERRA